MTGTNMINESSKVSLYHSVSGYCYQDCKTNQEPVKS